MNSLKQLHLDTHSDQYASRAFGNQARSDYSLDESECSHLEDPADDMLSIYNEFDPVFDNKKSLNYKMIMKDMK